MDNHVLLWVVMTKNPQCARFAANIAAGHLRRGEPLPPELLDWLAGALERIGAGEDAGQVLGTTRSKGRPKNGAGDTPFIHDEIMLCVSAMRKADPSLSLESVYAAVALQFPDTSERTVKRVWENFAKVVKGIKRPIAFTQEHEKSGGIAVQFNDGHIED